MNVISIKKGILFFLIILIIIFCFFYLIENFLDQKNKIPIAFFTRDEIPVNVGEEVRFWDGSEDEDGFIVGWLWNLGDGNTSNEQNITYIYSQAGTYVVSLIVTDNKGDISEPYYQEIKVN